MSAKAMKKMILAVVIGLLLIGCSQEPAIIQMKDVESPESLGAPEASVESDASIADEKVVTEPESVFVHVCGAVNNPDVYEMPFDSRIFEAIEMAGGFTKEAHQPSINLADKVTDGQQLIVPTHEEAANAPVVNQSSIEVSTAGSELVNINDADIAKLQELNGIGEARAKEILAYREKNGRFDYIEEIKNVSGIGDKLYERIKENIIVD